MNDPSFVKQLSEEAQVPPQTRGKARLSLSACVVLVLAGGAGWEFWTHQAVLTPAQSAPAIAKAPAAAVKVETVRVTQGDVPVPLTGLGTVQPFNSVTVKPHVSGQLKDIAFTEGQLVHTGDVLAHIDPKPFLPAVHQAEANLDKDQAQLKNTSADLKRTTSLAQSGYATGQALDTQKSQMSVQQAQIEADQAAVENARTQLDFTTITSPLTGVAGLRFVDAGNMITPSDAGLVTINQLEPIAVVFSVPSEAIGHWAVGQPGVAVPVTALSPDGQRTIGTGTLSLVDNHIDATTATIKLKASFPNTDHRLKPGQFVDARMQSVLLHNVLTVPSGAVQDGTAGPWVYLVQSDGTLAQRPVKVDRVVADRTVIGSGLAAGDTIVAAGQYGLKPGMAVSVAAVPPPGPEANRALRTE